MTLQPTKGPWKVSNGEIHADAASGKSPNGSVAICGEFYGPDAQANRRLVAAAPAMLEALEILAGNMNCVDQLMGNDDIIHAALKAARGI